MEGQAMWKILVVSLAGGVLLVPALAAQPGQPVLAGEVLRPTAEQWCPEGEEPSPDSDCIVPPVLIYATSPPYPEIALRGRITGKVEVEAVVAESGKVTEVRVVKPNRVFTAAAVDAVERRTYKPAYQRGEPVAVWVPVIVRFDLSTPGWRPVLGTTPSGDSSTLTVTPWGLEMPIDSGLQQPSNSRTRQGTKK
jgi:TonB family protein